MAVVLALTHCFDISVELRELLITQAVVALRGGAPRRWQYTFTRTELRIDPLHKLGKGARHPLSDFRAFTIEDVKTARRARVRTYIVLLPARRLGTVVELYLTGDDDKHVTVADRLYRLLPYDESAEYLRTERLLQRIARALRPE